jgi:PIN domain nuclease of toxin-antitoxin system
MDIFDASALLALIKEEKNADDVKERLMLAEKETDSAFIHQINFIEVAYYCLRKFGEIKTGIIISDFKSPDLGIVNYMDTDLALYTASLKAKYGLSFGDASGLAFTSIMEGTYWTKDKALEPVAEKEGIKMKLLV